MLPSAEKKKKACATAPHSFTFMNERDNAIKGLSSISLMFLFLGRMKEMNKIIRTGTSTKDGSFDKDESGYQPLTVTL